MIDRNEFQAAIGLANRHLQTVLPTILCHKTADIFPTTTLELPDGDFVDLSWTKLPDRYSVAPIVIIFHGLEGSVDSPYVQLLLNQIVSCDWIGVVMHFRGCSGRLNRLPRSYHSGDTGDAEYFIDWLRYKYPLSPLMAVGYSIGGNMLLKLAGTKGEDLGLQAIVAVSVPFQLDRCVNELRQGFSRVYQQYLLKSLKQKVLRKFEDHDYQTLIGLDRSQVHACSEFMQFDNIYTAPIHGFTNALDYYTKSSAINYLAEITQPALLLHAKDDPFMPIVSLPDKLPISSSTTLEFSENGGHVGFVSGNFWQPRFWLPERIVDFLRDY